MSTRYVWNKYSVTGPSDMFTFGKALGLATGFTSTSDLSNIYAPVACTSYVVDISSDPKYIVFRPAGSTTVLNAIALSNVVIVSSVNFPYIIIPDQDLSRKLGECAGYRIGKNASGGKDWWCTWTKDTSNTYNAAWVYNSNYRPSSFTEDSLGNKSPNTAYNEYLEFPNENNLTLSYASIKSLGYVSSSSSNIYPNNGIKDLYTYKYAGSDNIDPISISYSTQNPNAGSTINITVTPRSNTYGGTIRYIYDYSIDGGTTWVVLENGTTSTSINPTVPANATQYRVRVHAFDNMGFTSTDYVTGANLTVATSKVYVGVNGATAKVSKVYVGVNGKARLVTKGYIGVNGIARQFL